MTAKRFPAAIPNVPLGLDSPSPYRELKDPCPAHDGLRWHLFGTGVRDDGFDVFHATSRDLFGPWTIEQPVDVSTLAGSCLAAPGVVADGEVLHMFLQTTYNELGGRIEHLVSTDGGRSFGHARTALTSLPGTDEAGMYDPHPAQVAGEKYLVYSAFSVVGQPDLHLARSASGTWDGPWERLGAVLRHEDVWCHNQRGCDSYEWGLEAGQLLELPDGRVLLNAVCFLPGQPEGARQRVFVALANDVTGPYEVLGPVLTPAAGQGAGENGHACFVLDQDELVLLFQERSVDDPHWRLGLAYGGLSLLPGTPDVEDVA